VGYGRPNLTKALATRGWGVISRMVGGGYARMVRIGSEDGMGQVVRMVARMAGLMPEDLPVCTSQNSPPSFGDQAIKKTPTYSNIYSNIALIPNSSAIPQNQLCDLTKTMRSLCSIMPKE
jgi:hypothetical protein